MILPAVKFKKVTHDHACSLQALVVLYITEQERHLQKQSSVQFHSAIQELALLMELYLMLRGKIESRKEKFSMSLKCQQAVTLLFACNYGHKKGGDYNDLVALTYINEIDRQLKSLNTVRMPSANLYQAHLQLINNS